MPVATKKRTASHEKHRIEELELEADELDKLLASTLTLEDLKLLPSETLKPNQYFIAVEGKRMVPAKLNADGVTIRAINRKIEAMGIRARKGNEEQLCALDALLDDDIKVVVLTGRAGSGKTLLTLAAALQKTMDEPKYKQIIITKPMTQVGDNELGALPGEVDQKFSPYLENYTSNLEEIVTTKPDFKVLNIEMKPLQLIRGVSWAEKFIIADEVQTLTHHEMLTLGTRVADGSKLVIMGDLRQRDTAITEAETGIYYLLRNKHFTDSPLTAAIELVNVERSKVTELFTDVFDEGA